MSLTPVTIKSFQREIAEAQRNYAHHVICLGLLPEELDLTGLVESAIAVYAKRGEMRHGVAVNGFITVILSYNGENTPKCGIYFNLSSPYTHDTSRNKA